jgi:tRNA/rRNA methyltransferase
LITAGNRPATKGELVNFFVRLEKALEESGFLYPPEKTPIMLRNIRNLFQRADLTEQEVNTLHGIVSALWDKRRN